MRAAPGVELQGEDAGPTIGDRVIPAKRVSRFQVRHVLIYNVLPAIGFLATLVSLFWLPFGWVEACLLGGMLYLTLGLGTSVGFHRHFTHRSFLAPKAVRYLLAICGSMAAQGPLVAWVATHRRHHQHSDTQGDPHSPYYRNEHRMGLLAGLWHAHAGWLVHHDMPNPVFYAKELLQDRGLSRVSQLYPCWVVLGLLLPTVLGAVFTQSWIGALTGFLWGGLARLFICGQLVWSINSICHTFGTATYQTDDRSTNNLVLALPTFGEAWHNNHHAYPSSARFGINWWQVDLGWWTVCVMKLCGLVSNVKSPPGKQREDVTDSPTGGSVTHHA